MHESILHHRLLVALAWLGLSPVTACLGQAILTSQDPEEQPGQRPYEMLWANRTEPAPPSLTFDQLEGWRMEVEAGAEAVLRPSRAQDVWNRPVSLLRYRGPGKSESTPRILLFPPHPVPLPEDADSVDSWLYGNRWAWVNPPDTPPVRILLRLRDAQDTMRQLHLDDVRWQEWWLLHKRLPEDWKRPLRFEALEIAGGWQTEWRTLFLDSIRFYREPLNPIKLDPRPRRNLTLFPGQSPGANTGPGKLPFPTREETILPVNLASSHGRKVSRQPDGQYLFRYVGDDCSVAYLFDPAQGWSSLRAELDDQPVGRLLDGAQLHQTPPPEKTELESVALKNSILTATYSDGTTLELRLWRKSLVLDLINQTRQATGLDFGQLSELVEPRVVWIPYLNYGGGPHPSLLLSRAGTNRVFTSIWLDWYRSHGSEPYAAESASTNTARINGGVRYHTLTDGRRNPLFERIFITVSPRFEEALPTIPTPVGRHAKQAVDRLWQESWGPDDYEKQMRRSRTLRAYGIEKLIQCNHEIAWRDGGESFTLRTKAAPGKGGDLALQRYVTHQRGLGWLAGLYSNYTDFAPVNEFWDPDCVQRQPDGNWRSAWPRCWALKPVKAVEFDALLAPVIKQRYNPNSAYTDVHTAVAPWHYNDYDARLPGAGTFTQTLYAYGEILRHDSEVYGGPIFSEGTYHWLYAGLADGNYALAYDGRPLATSPLLPAFDLYQIHPKECDVGMGWTAHFCDAIPGWQKPENLDRAIDRFLLHTLAYGHIGWLVEETHGIQRTCRSYYMLQQVQARYGLKEPTRIAYWDGETLCDLSEAVIRDLPAQRRQLHLEYPGNLQLWLNDHPRENWAIPLGHEKLILPPAGWAAWQEKGDLLTYSALQGTNRIDYLRSDDYVYLDSRGQSLDLPEAQVNGALALRPAGRRQLEVIHIAGSQSFTLRRPFGLEGSCASAAAFDVDGNPLAAPVLHDSPGQTELVPVAQAVRYLLRFQ